MGKKIIFIVLFSVISVLLPAVSGDKTEDGEYLQELTSSEVKEYQGKNLSSIPDFWENSIKGTQHINVDNFTLRVETLVGGPSDFTYDQVHENTTYKKVVTLNCVEGWCVYIL